MRHVCRRLTSAPASGPPDRSGASLIEVMMATLVMGIGVLAVMALFPVAYLRAIQASQLTNSVLLKERAEVNVDLFDLTSDLYIPQPDVGFVNRCIIDPLGGFNGLNDTYGVDNTLSAEFYTPGNPFSNPNYFHLNGTSTPDPGAEIPLRRLSFVTGWTNQYTATFGSYQPDLIANNNASVLDAVGLPDRWETVFQAIPSSSGPLQVEFSHDEVSIEDLTALTALSDARLVMVDITGKRSEVRIPTLVTPDTGSATGTIDWNTSLPATVGAIADCRVEIPERRFTWLLTVRKTGVTGGSTTDIDCVIYHNRPAADAEEELVHTVTNIAGNSIDVQFESYPSGATAPLRRGAYVFDPAHARWYRVQDIDNETATDATITLDRFPTDTITQLTIPRGVVAVFSLDTRTVLGR